MVAILLCDDSNTECGDGNVKLSLSTPWWRVGGVEVYLITFLLTPWSRVLLEKLTGIQLVKKFLAFYGARRFIAAITSSRHLSLSLACSMQSMPLYPTSWRSSLILSSLLRLGLPSGLFPSGFPTNILYSLSSPPYAIHAPPISFFSILSPEL